MFAPLYIGWRYANSNKSNHFIAFINFFSVSGIALGLAALIVVASVMNGFEGQLKQRILGLIPHFVVAQSVTDLSSDIKQHPDVQAFMPFAEVEAAVQSYSALRPVVLQGIDSNRIAPLSQVNDGMLSGDLSLLQAGEYGIVIGRALASALNVNVGDQVRIMSAESTRYTLIGRIPSQRKFRIVGIFEMGSQIDDSVALVAIQDLARLLRKSTDELSQTRLFLNDPFQYQAVKTELMLLSVEFDDWRTRQGPLFDAVKMEKNMMSLMLLLIIAVAAFNIVSALVMVVTEKQGDIAILQTQGLTQRGVWLVFLVNGLSNGLKGTALGSALGLTLAFNINELLLFVGIPIHLYLPNGVLPVLIQWHQLLGMILLSLVLCLVATLYPAFRAAKVRPAEALRYE
ncbi:lipoprotein-releasing ABC transporter permease subunit [Alteromonas sp. a30]|nr:lipoprotein-releasing ABC transporter permease subunit [Alteromonas sp. a30]